jgi:flagellar biosynthesis protein FliQ
MDAQQAVDLTREAMLTALTLGAPLLLVALAVGLVVGLLQTLTQVQDQTISFVPKIVAVVAAIGFCLPWLIQRLVEYSQLLMANIPATIMGR